MIQTARKMKQFNISITSDAAFWIQSVAEKIADCTEIEPIKADGGEVTKFQTKFYFEQHIVKMLRVAAARGIVKVNAGAWDRAKAIYNSGERVTQQKIVCSIIFNYMETGFKGTAFQYFRSMVLFRVDHPKEAVTLTAVRNALIGYHLAKKL